MKNRIYITQETADVFCGRYGDRDFCAYLVQNRKTVKRPSTKLREKLERRRKAEKRFCFLKDIIKGSYVLSILMAGMTAAHLFEMPYMTAMEMVRAIACVVWVAVPTSIYIIRKVTNE